jgi:hypothetical protein
MQNQLFDVKYPVLKTVNQIKKPKKKCAATAKDQDLYSDNDNDDDDDDGDEDGDEDRVVVNHTQQFALYKSKKAAAPSTSVLSFMYTKSVCPKCNRTC